METVLAIAITVNQAGPNLLNFPLPSIHPKSSFGIVLESVAIAIALAVTAVVICPSPLWP